MRWVNRIGARFERPYRFGEIAERGSLAVRLPAHPQIRIDEQKFLYLLRASISVGALEKIGLIGCLATVSQQQADGMIAILEEEVERFSALESSHHEELRKHEAEAAEAWKIVCANVGQSQVVG